MILNYLKARAVKGIYPFHTPGHKGNSDYFHDIDHVLMDITEVRGADNLRQPDGIIKAVEERLAQAYGAYRSFMLVNGSSVGILAAMLYAAGDGEKVVAARNCHVSVNSGLALCGANPVYVYPSVTPYGFAGGVSPSSIREALAANPDTRAVIVTSPTYEGLCSDIAEIAEITRSYGVLLIVDEAHGAHFGLHPDLPKSAVACADIVIQSMHKTMLAPNQAAVMHSGVNIDAGRLRGCLNLVQTTSPSYVTMAMIERCANIASDSSNFDCFTRTLATFRASLSSFENVKLLNGGVCGNYDIHDIDISKLVFVTKRGIGADIYRELLDNHQIELEMYGPAHAVALTSIADTKDGFSRLYYALRKLDQELASCVENAARHLDPNLLYHHGTPAVGLSPRLAQLRASHEIELEFAAGEICQTPITPYPPGIPILLPGEIFDESMVEHLKRLALADIMITGVVDGKVRACV